MSVRVQNDVGLGRIPPQGWCRRVGKGCIDIFVSSCAIRLNQIEEINGRERSWSESAERGCCKIYTLFCRCLCCGWENTQHDQPSSIATTEQGSVSTINVPTFSKNRGAEAQMSALQVIAEDQKAQIS